MIELNLEELNNIDGGGWLNTAWEIFGTVVDPWYNVGSNFYNNGTSMGPSYYQDVYNHAHGIN
ncbi:hypothetical protein [Clostridium sp. UBA1652]|uniref:hypothetical protein n=1 Tax=Clostridium sp. UBA1652 TaxID=1946348 RepID=UPI00257AB81D|nr:hypothetical protein [Clostridium sp. UBA1652]